jgi:hypothetical protein
MNDACVIKRRMRYQEAVGQWASFKNAEIPFDAKKASFLTYHGRMEKCRVDNHACVHAPVGRCRRLSVSTAQRDVHAGIHASNGRIDLRLSWVSFPKRQRNCTHQQPMRPRLGQDQ